MKLSSLISTTPKTLPGGVTVNNLAKVLGTASEGVVIGLGASSVWNALRNIGVPVPVGQFETIANTAVAYKVGGTAGILGYLLASGALSSLTGATARATGSPAQSPRMTEVY
jgi:hypothetical protein